MRLPEENCLLCKSTKNSTSNCKVQNIGYSIACTKCTSVSYEGETCRNGYIRGQEHLKQLENKSDKSALYKHIRENHENDQEVEFSMKIKGIFKNAMTRQIDEALRIQRKDPKLLLNSKKEYYGPVIQRKILESQKMA